jgi:hypothetical protein
VSGHAQVDVRNGPAWKVGWGSLITVVTKARAVAAACRRLTLDGIDPIEARKARRAQAALEAARVAHLTFEDRADHQIAAEFALRRPGTCKCELSVLW